jgi:hypothetical protein
MAATRLTSGVQREIWQEVDGQIGGPPQVVQTGIRVSAGLLPRIRAMLVITGNTGALGVTATLSVSSTGYLAVTIANGFGGTTITWLLDVALTQSQDQANDPHGVPSVAIVNGVIAPSGGGGSETLAQAYAFGVNAADQTMTVTTAKGGVSVDCLDAGVSGDLVGFEMRQSVAHSTPMTLSRVGNDTVSAHLQLNKTRGTYAIPADVQAFDEIGAIEFYGRVTAASHVGARVVSRVESVTAGLSASLGLYASYQNTCSIVAQLDRQAGTAGLLMTAYGTSPAIVPAVTGAGVLGTNTNRWGSAHINVVSVGIAVPSALVHITGSTAAAGTAPLKIAPGTVLTAPESGAIESTTTHIYWTNAAGVRLQLDNDAATTPNLANVYNAGNSAANQTMTLTNAHGGGILIDCTDAGVTGDLSGLTVQQSTAHLTPVTLARAGDDTNCASLEFNRFRGTVAAPTNVQAADSVGMFVFTSRVGGAAVPGMRLLVHVLDPALATYTTSMDWLAMSSGALSQVLQLRGLDASGSTGLTCYGNAPQIVPNTTNTGSLGTAAKTWLAANVATLNASKTIFLDCTGALVTGDAASLEVRQSTAHATPVVFSYAGNSVTPAILQFSKSRGTYGTPVAVQVGDVLGEVDFNGYLGGSSLIGGRFRVSVTSVAGGNLDSTFDLVVVKGSTLVPAMNIDANANVSIGGATAGANAARTLVLPVANAVSPATSVAQVHVYAQQWFGAHSALAISQEEATITLGGSAPAVSRLIPMVVNGVSLYVFASVSAS